MSYCRIILQIVLAFHLLLSTAAAQLFRDTAETFPRTELQQKNPIPNSEALLSQGFDTTAFPPDGWTHEVLNTGKTWQRLHLPEVPFSAIDEQSKASAVCRWSLEKQDEWLITPLLDAEDYQSLYVRFYGGFSKTFLDYANLHVLGKHQDSTNWKPLWNAKDDTLSDASWQWRYQEIAIFQYAGQQFQLAWQYAGRKGDLTAIDGVEVIGGGPARGTDITAFSLPGQTEEPEIDTVNHSVQVLVANGTPLTNIAPEMELSPGARAEPPVGEPQNFSLEESFIYTIYPADATVDPQAWKIFISMENVSAQANILDFTLPAQTGDAEIDTTNHAVSIEVAYGTNLDSLAPDITISAGAEIEPGSGEVRAFEDGEPLTYTVYPQDPDADPVTWEVTVNVQDYLNDILAFSLDEQTHPAEIYAEDHEVFLEVASDADLSGLTPSVEVSPGATVSPDSGQSISVTPDVPVIYTVTAANGDQQEWEVYIYKQITTELIQLFDQKDSMPENWHTDTLNGDYTWRVQKLGAYPFDSINPYSHYSAVCPWSIEPSDEKLISPVVELPPSQSSGLVFYAGFSRQWLDSATLTLKIRNQGENDTQTLWNARTDTSSGADWRWRMVWIELDKYAGSEMELIWHYKGRFGDLVAVDDIYVAETSALEREFQSHSAKTLSVKKEQPFRIYPNPAHFRVYFSKAVTHYTLYNIHGRLIKQGNSGFTRKISLSGLPKGIYILKIKRNGQHLSRKIIKQ